MESERRTIYLVDLENIGQTLLYEQIESEPKSTYIIFYSIATLAPGAILEHIPEDVDVKFVDCYSGGNNAMDFCICAAAGRLSIEHGCSIRILSDDKGYDPMLNMLHQEGIRISRKKAGNNVSVNGDPGPREHVPIIRAIRQNVPKKYQDDCIAVLPGAPNRKRAHEMLQSILPPEIVAGTYKKLKKHIPKEK